jgi:hypothetical protein
MKDKAVLSTLNSMCLAPSQSQSIPEFALVDCLRRKGCLRSRLPYRANC